MTKPKHNLPTMEALSELSRWARVVLLARAMRRVQPLYAVSWPDAPKKDFRIIEAAIQAGEASAAQAAAAADVHAAALKAMDIYGELPDDIMISDRGYGYEIPFAASRVAFAVSETKPHFASEGLDYTADIAAGFAQSAKKPALFRQYLALIRREFETLQNLCKSGKLKKNTPVTGELLGELWPNGLPEGWPAPTTVRLKASTKKPLDLQQLRLPPDLVAFLQAGNKVKYRAKNTEVGPTKLKPLEHLRTSTFEVECQPTTSSKAKAKPASKIKKVQGVDLVAECDAYGPDGILVWLPSLQCFAQHDPDHLRMVIFPAATWADIVAKPARYLDAQWNEFEKYGRYLDPRTDLKPPKAGK